MFGLFHTDFKFDLELVLDPDPNATRTIINIYLILDRRYGYYLVNAFFQTFALTILSYVCFFIDIEDFTDRSERKQLFLYSQYF